MPILDELSGTLTTGDGRGVAVAATAAVSAELTTVPGLGVEEGFGAEVDGRQSPYVHSGSVHNT